MQTLAEINQGWPNTCTELQEAMRRTHPNTAWVRLHRAAVACSSICTQDWLPDWSRVHAAADLGPLVIDCSTDAFNGFEQALVAWLEPRFSEFTILSPDARYLAQPQEHICYFPYFFLCLNGHDMHADAVVTNSQRTHPVSCINGRARTHRIENWLKIRQRSWFNRCLFRMNRRFDPEAEMCESGLDFEDPAMLDQFLILLPSLPDPAGIDHTANDPAYVDSYINLVPESHMHTGELFVSEKTFKPLLAGQMAFWLAAHGTVAFLRDLGFDMFDDYIDHAYDRETNWHRRIDLIHQELNRMIDLDFEQIFVATESRRLYNKHYIQDPALHERLNAQCVYHAGMI